MRILIMMGRKSQERGKCEGEEQGRRRQEEEEKDQEEGEAD